MRNIYLLLLFTVLCSATAFAHTKPNPYVLCLAHINNVDLFAISEGKRIKVDVDDRKVKGVVKRITSDSIFFKGGKGVAIASIHRIKVPLPERKVLVWVLAVPSVALMAAVPALLISLDVPIGASLYIGAPFMVPGSMGLIGSLSLRMKWFETSYEWKLSGMTVEELKSTYGDRTKVRFLK